jgi:hypothetical protein
MPFSGTSAHERRNVTVSAAPDSILEDNSIPSTTHTSGSGQTAAGKSRNRLENRCPTSIHTLVSATLKLSRITTIPPERKAFRGLGRMQLGPEWFSSDQRGARSGVELAFMSTTLSRELALAYSGMKIGGVGTILEFDVGAIDCGAQLGFLSQYPGPKCLTPLHCTLHTNVAFCQLSSTFSPIGPVHHDAICRLH